MTESTEGRTREPLFLLSIKLVFDINLIDIALVKEGMDGLLLLGRVLSDEGLVCARSWC